MPKDVCGVIGESAQAVQTLRASSLISVARAAGVSVMTASRVMRNSPCVGAETRQRVLKAAAEVGYRPDPLIQRLMGAVHGDRRQPLRAVIGVVRDDLPEDDLHDQAYQYVSTRDIRARAEQLGYSVEEFLLGRDGLTQARLSGILHARGIEGLIVSPQSSQLFSSHLDYSPFAVATFGYGLPAPALHRAGTNITQGILKAARELERRGYRRIGLAITEWIDARADHTYSSALLYHQQKVSPKNRVPVLLFPENNVAREADDFCTWFRRHRPDVVISFDSYVPDWITRRLRLRVPEEVGFVVHDWTEKMTGLAGIHCRRSHVAAAAVDLVATQLLHNEHGVPEVPRQILIPPAWIDGPSIRLAQ